MTKPKLTTFKPGDLVEWKEDDGRILCGRIEKIDAANQVAELTLFIVDKDGKLAATTTRKRGVALSKLRITGKPLADSEAASLTDGQFIAYARSGELPTAATVADLSDDQFVERLREQRSRTSTEVAEARQRATSADLTEATADLTTQMVEGYRAELSGEAADLRHRTRVNAEREELLEHWLQEHKKGEVLPRDVEEELRDLGRFG